MSNNELDVLVREFAMAEGADLLGIAPVETYADYCAEVEKRKKETGAARTDFMIAADDTTFFTRLSSAMNTLPTAKAIILIGVYGYDETAAYRNTRQELRGKIARVYSYYPVVRQVTEKLTAFIQNLGYNATYGQDVPLKYVADRIGLGCYGKNGLLMTEPYGSYVALRDVITDAPLEPDVSDKVSPCHDCDLCLKACPTGALYAPYKVNPGLCLNPITRKADRIAPELRSKMRDWICGCDICQEVCPVNRKLLPRKVDPRSGFDPKHHASHRNLGGMQKNPQLLSLLSDEYPDVIRRNAAIALANIGSGKKEAFEALEHHIEGASDDLRDYFRWAMERLSNEGIGKPE